MIQEDATVFIVDDDASTREALDALLRSVGIKAVSFGAVRDFLATSLPDSNCCLVLDVRMPGQSGLDLQQQLIRSGTDIPIIFITGHADVPMTVRAMKAGAEEFLEKPFRDQDLLDAINSALEHGRERRSAQAALGALRDRWETLTARERQILPLVARGLLNKQIAAELGVTEITVKVHRGQMMRKMKARSVADLVRMSDRLGFGA